MNYAAIINDITTSKLILLAVVFAVVVVRKYTKKKLAWRAERRRIQAKTRLAEQRAEVLENILLQTKKPILPIDSVKKD